MRITKKGWQGNAGSREVRAVFDEFSSGKQRLGQKDIRRALSRMKLPSSDELVDDLVREYDQSGDGYITFQDFQRHVNDREKRIRKAFNRLDADKSGLLTTDELLCGLKNMGMNATPADARKMVQLVDRNGDNLVNVAEFRRFCLLLPVAQLRSNVGWPWLESAVEEFTAVNPPPSETLKSLGIGGVAGSLARTAVAPLDRLRNMLMTGGGSGAANPGIFASFQSIVRTEGLAGLFRGNTTGVLKVFPAKAIEFAVYARFKNALLSRRGEPGTSETNLDRFVAGSAAGATSQLVLHPLDVAKLQQSLGASGGVFAILAHIAGTHGAGGLYRGLGLKLCDTILASAVGFTSYDFAKERFRKSTKRRPRPAESAILGAATSCLSITLLMPLQIVNKRMMAQGQPGVRQYRNVAHAFRAIAQDEGLSTFFTGATVTYAKMIPQIALTFFLYEALAQETALGGLERYRKRSPR